MALGVGVQHVELYDRGGTTRMGPLDGVTRIRWSRVRDDISEATVDLGTPSRECVEKALTRMEPGRTEMVIYRNGDRVWEGPIVRVAWGATSIQIVARDIGHYLYRTVMRSAYDNRNPNSTTVLDRMTTVINAELARKEALDPPLNVLPFLDVRAGTEDARTARFTEAWQYTVFEHLDDMAARAGLDYTVLGRSLIMWDTHNQALGKTRVATAEDFLGDPIITSYGMEGATFAAVTDGLGNAGYYGGADGYYGLIEILDTAYDEEQDEGEPPSVTEMQSQAQRNLAGRNPTPVVVRIPDGSQINPQSSVFDMEHLVPGMWVPLRADLPGRTMSQMQKLDELRVEWLPEKGETFRVTLGTAPGMLAVEEGS